MTVKEINSRSESNNIEKKFSQICDSFCEDITDYFEDIRKRISENMLKLRLSVIEQTVDSIIDNFFREGIKDLNESLKGELKELNKEIYKL